MVAKLPQAKAVAVKPWQVTVLDAANQFVAYYRECVLAAMQGVVAKLLPVAVAVTTEAA